MSDVATGLLEDPGHDAREREQYFLALRGWLNGYAERAVKPAIRVRAAALGLPVDRPVDPSLRGDVRRAVREDPAYRYWSSLWCRSQDLLWRYVGESVEARAPRLRDSYRTRTGSRGSLRLDPALQLPRYLVARDVHAMPGGYGRDEHAEDLRAGAMYDRGGALYQLKANGGALNDGRGQTMVAYLHDVWPGLAPRRILELGCSVGNSTLALARHFPDAELHAIDVSPALLRYAHLRAEALGARVHFSQMNAEATSFEEASFDLVVSHVMLHETSAAALPRIFAECRRLLRPGGVTAHLEVPYRYEHMPIDEVVIRDWQGWHNGEPFWGGCCTADFAALLDGAGFEDLAIGYQPATAEPSQPRRGRFSERGAPDPRYWFVAGGRRPA